MSAKPTVCENHGLFAHVYTSSPFICCLETTGAWEDQDGNDRPDAGETVSLTVVVANTGTVTLDALSVSDSMNSAGCTSAEPFQLGQGEERECIAVLQVSTGT